MGISYLQNYMRCSVARHNPAASYVVSLAELAEKFRERNPTSVEAVLVIDGYPLFWDFYNTVCGGQSWLGTGNFDALVTLAKRFTEKVEACGLTPVFLFDASAHDNTREMWCAACRNVQTGTQKIFNLLKRNQAVAPLIADIYHLPECISHSLPYIVKVHCQAEVQMTFAEHNPTLARYAKENNCVAIIGNDSDLIMLDKGSALYLTTEQFDYKNMKARVYDGIELCRHLDLSPEHLRLFSMLLGNAIVFRPVLDAFHRRLACGPWSSDDEEPEFKAIVPAVVKYLSGFEPGEHTRRNLYNIVFAAYGSDQHLEVVEEYIECSFLRDAASAVDRPRCGKELRTYQLIQEAKEAVDEQRMSPFCYQILARKGFEFRKCCMEDFREGEVLPPTSLFLRPLRQYAYWILLQETEGNMSVEEWCYHPNTELKKPEIVSALPIASVKHPGLRDLWSASSEDIAIKRWLMIQHALALSSEQIKQTTSLSHLFILPLLALSHLNSFNFLNQFEIDALLATVLAQKNSSRCGSFSRATLLSSRIVKVPTNPRAIHIAAIFARTLVHVSWLLEAVGIVGNQIDREYVMPAKFYDGLTFQQLYLAFEIESRHKVSAAQDARRQAGELMTVSSPWKPSVTKRKVAPQPAKDEDSDWERISLLHVLNNLVPEKLDNVVSQFATIFKGLSKKTDRPVLGSMILRRILRHAVRAPNFGQPYARLCKSLSQLLEPESVDETDQSFTSMLICSVQREFEILFNGDGSEFHSGDDGEKSSEFGVLCALVNAKSGGTNIRNDTKNVSQSDFADQKRQVYQEVMEELDSRELGLKLGLMNFIGELYLAKVLTTPVMIDVIDRLMKPPAASGNKIEPSESDLRCVCLLVTKFGKLIEHKLVEIKQKSEGEQSCDPESTIRASDSLQIEIPSPSNDLTLDHLDAAHERNRSSDHSDDDQSCRSPFSDKFDHSQERNHSADHSAPTYSSDSQQRMRDHSLDLSQERNLSKGSDNMPETSDTSQEGNVSSGAEVDLTPKRILPTDLSAQFQHLSKLSADERISKRVRFMILDVIELRDRHNWVTREDRLAMKCD